MVARRRRCTTLPASKAQRRLLFRHYCCLQAPHVCAMWAFGLDISNAPAEIKHAGRAARPRAPRSVRRPAARALSGVQRSACPSRGHWPSNPPGLLDEPFRRPGSSRKNCATAAPAARRGARDHGLRYPMTRRRLSRSPTRIVLINEGPSNRWLARHLLRPPANDFVIGSWARSHNWVDSSSGPHDLRLSVRDPSPVRAAWHGHGTPAIRASCESVREVRVAVATDTRSSGDLATREFPPLRCAHGDLVSVARRAVHRSLQVVRAPIPTDLPWMECACAQGISGVDPSLQGL